MCRAHKPVGRGPQSCSTAPACWLPRSAAGFWLLLPPMDFSLSFTTSTANLPPTPTVELKKPMSLVWGGGGGERAREPGVTCPDLQTPWGRGLALLGGVKVSLHPQEHNLHSCF